MFKTIMDDETRGFVIYDPFPYFSWYSTYEGEDSLNVMGLVLFVSYMSTTYLERPSNSHMIW